MQTLKTSIVRVPALISIKIALPESNSVFPKLLEVIDLLISVTTLVFSGWVKCDDG